jgi:hypothetical protein
MFFDGGPVDVLSLKTLLDFHTKFGLFSGGLGIDGDILLFAVATLFWGIHVHGVVVCVHRLQIDIDAVTGD